MRDKRWERVGLDRQWLSMELVVVGSRRSRELMTVIGLSAHGG